MKQLNDNVQQALEYAKRYFREQRPLQLSEGDLDNLYVLFSHEEPGFWRCYVSCDTLDKYCEHLLIEYRATLENAFIQYCVIDDDASILIFDDGTTL